MKDFGIKDALKTLGIKSSNAGVSTGQKWIDSKGPILESFSPADGKLIGKVRAADEKSFHQVIQVSHKAFLNRRRRC